MLFVKLGFYEAEALYDLLNVAWIPGNRFIRHPQRWSEFIGTTTKKAVVPVATSNVKLFLKTIWRG